MSTFHSLLALYKEGGDLGTPLFLSPTLGVIHGSVNMEDGMEPSTNSLLKDGNVRILVNMNPETPLCS